MSCNTNTIIQENILMNVLDMTKEDIIEELTPALIESKGLETYDDLVDAFKSAKKYLYFTPISYYPLMNLKQGDFLEDEGECNSDPEPESDSSETSDEGSNSEDEGLKED